MELELTEKKLRELFCDEGLSDSQIAEKYGMKISQVRYKRNKYGIKLKSNTIEEFLINNKNGIDILNNHAKNILQQPEKMDQISKALTRYIFRDGPVEDIHSEGKLSQEDMKTLNKFMVNKIAGIIKVMSEGQWAKLASLIDSYEKTDEWDLAEPDTTEIEKVFNYFCNR